MSVDDPEGAEPEAKVPTQEEGWEGRDSGPVPLPPSRQRRERISQVDTGEIPLSELELELGRDSGALLVPTLDELLDTFTRLLVDASPSSDDEAVLGDYLQAMAQAMPGRRFVVRLVSPHQGLDLVRSTARMIPGQQEKIRITRHALVRGGLRLEHARDLGIPIIQQFEPDFDPEGHGFDVALAHEGTLLGVLGVEFSPEQPIPDGERARVRFAALQMVNALGRARLRSEATYLSGYLARLLNNANVPILVIDRHRRVQVASQALLDLLGRERDELVGNDFLQLVPEGERGHLLPAVVGALRGRALDAFEIGLIRGDGRVARTSTNLVSILSPQGEVDGVIAIGRDLTELRDLESQVVQAEKLATLGQLAAGVVHELNNPLTSISVYAEYLYKKGQREESAADDVEKLRRIVQAAERILRFTRDLVTYARPSTETPQELDVESMLDQCLVFCEHVIRDHGTAVEKAFESGLSIRAVRGQLHQIFINLITNACHAMPDGAGKLVLRAEKDEGGVSICVTDNGAGIPTDQQESIFEPFFSTKGEGKGTGLGLSIVRKIVQQHAGTIEVRSVLGEGTTFRVWLPES